MKMREIVFEQSLWFLSGNNFGIFGRNLGNVRHHLAPRVCRRYRADEGIKISSFRQGICLELASVRHGGGMESFVEQVYD